MIKVVIIFHNRVLDYDTYSAHDSIGKVYIDLNPLLIKNNPSVINGWFPIYDTMRGKISLYPLNVAFLNSSTPIFFLFSQLRFDFSFSFNFISGIRGELNFIVKVDLFSDFNRFRQSSCGVQLFCCKYCFSRCITLKPHRG